MTRRTGGRTSIGRRAAGAFAGATTMLLVLTGCTGTQPDPEPTPSSGVSERPSPGDPQRVDLSFAVWGPDEVLAAHRRNTRRYDRAHPEVTIELITYPDRRAAASALASGKVADVFLLDRRNLSMVLEQEISQPVDELLDERGVDFGDGYQRMGLKAFGPEAHLQCMPYGTDPMVIYYNTELIDFERMARRGLAAPEPGDWWTFEQFTLAAEFASRPRRGTKGVLIEPTLAELTPFVLSGGGQVFDDLEAPTSLALSEEDSREALERTLEVLRNPAVTPTTQQVRRRDALELFGNGRVAMIAGHRDLVPMLREVKGLAFDVMPMPSLDSRATIGEMTGMCLAADPGEPGPEDDVATTVAAADFLVDVVSTEAMSRVARTGYLVPANLEVGTADAFVQPDSQPAHPEIYVDSVRQIELGPLISSWQDLGQAIDDLLFELLNDPVLTDLEPITQEIDEASRTVLGPEESPEPASPEASTGSDD